jgi:hypothetical protein
VIADRISQLASPPAYDRPVTNPLAYALHRRMGDRNLNRNLVPTDTPTDFEDRIANWLCPLLAQHDALLDLHSFHTAGKPFVMLGPEDNSGALEPFARAAEETALALSLGVHRFVDGWLDTYAAGVARRLEAGASSREADVHYGVGTTEYMRAQGGIALTLECGQHDDPAAPIVAWRAIHSALAHLRLSAASAPAAVTDTEALRLYQVVDRATQRCGCRSGRASTGCAGNHRHVPRRHAGRRIAMATSFSQSQRCRGRVDSPGAARGQKRTASPAAKGGSI